MSSSPLDQRVLSRISRADAKWLFSRIVQITTILGESGEHWAKGEVERGKYTLNDAIRRVTGQRDENTSLSASKRSRLLARFLAAEIRSSTRVWMTIESEIRRHLTEEQAKATRREDDLIRQFDRFIIKRFNGLVTFEDLERLLKVAAHRAKQIEHTAKPSPTEIPEDIESWLRELTSKSVASTVTMVDASQQLARLDETLNSEIFRLEAAQIKDILSNLFAWLSRLVKSTNRHIFSVATVNMISRCFYVLLTGLRDVSSSKMAKHAYRTSESILFEVCKRGEKAFCWVFFLDFLAYTSELVGTSIRTRVSPDFLGARYGELESHLTRALLEALEEGRVQDAALIDATAAKYEDLTNSLRTSVRSNFEHQSGRFPPAAQEWILNALDIRAAKQLQYASPAENPLIRQAALILLHLWDTRDSTDHPNVFDEYQHLAAASFRIRLRGTPGETEDFDPRFHEATGPIGRTVRIVRPGVEWSDPPNSSVIIRSLVRS